MRSYRMEGYLAHSDTHVLCCCSSSGSSAAAFFFGEARYISREIMRPQQIQTGPQFSHCRLQKFIVKKKKELIKWEKDGII